MMFLYDVNRSASSIIYNTFCTNDRRRKKIREQVNGVIRKTKESHTKNYKVFPENTIINNTETDDYQQPTNHE